jgi:hypothetical protein
MLNEMNGDGHDASVADGRDAFRCSWGGASAASGGLDGLYYWLSIHRPVTDARKHTPPPPTDDVWSDTKW